MLMKIQYLSLQTLVLENLDFITFISFIIYFLFKNGLKRNVHFLTFSLFYLLLLKYFIFIFATVLEVYPPDYFGQLQRPLDINFIFLIKYQKHHNTGKTQHKIVKILRQSLSSPSTPTSLYVFQFHFLFRTKPMIIMWHDICARR